MKKWILLFIVTIVAFATGCSKNPQETKDKNHPPTKKTQTEQNQAYQQPNLKRELTETEKQLMKLPGTYSGTNYNETKVKEALDRLPNHLTAEQYFDEFLKLLAEDYRPSVTTFVNFDPKVNVNHQRPDENIVLPASKKLHVSILLDASGSMRAKIKQKDKMTSAKEAILDFASRLPKNATVSLRVYGHKGTSNAKDKSLSCKSTEEIYHAVGVDQNKFQKVLDQIKPAGWTPIANALESVKKDVNPATTESIVYVVSDGIETCGGNPIKVAKELNQSQVKTVVNIIGFDVDNNGQKLLKQVAEAGNGTFASVADDKALKDFLQKEYGQLQAEWEQWKEKGKADAMNQKEAKKKLMTETKEKMKALAETEKAHLKIAHEYLDDKFGDTYPESEMFNKILDRYSLAWGYAVDTGNRLWSEAVENGNKVWSDVVDEGNKKISETIDKKNR